MARTPTPLAGPVPLLGRLQELRAIEGTMNAVEAGLGGLVAFRGEGGIGKTRLAEEVTTHAVARGLVDGVGIGLAGRRRTADVALAGDARPARDVDAAQLLDDHGAAGELEPERFTRFRAVTAALAEAANERPVLAGARRRPRDRSGRTAVRAVRDSLPASGADALVVTCRPMVDVPEDVRKGSSTSSMKARPSNSLRSTSTRSSRCSTGPAKRRTVSRTDELLELSGGNPLLALELVASRTDGSIASTRRPVAAGQSLPVVATR